MKLFEIRTKSPFYGKILNLFVLAEDEDSAFSSMENKLFQRTKTDEYFPCNKYSLLTDRKNITIEEVSLLNPKVLFQETFEPSELL